MSVLTSKERFARMYDHRDADRVPIIDSPWGATVERWHREGMPAGVGFVEYFGLDGVAHIRASEVVGADFLPAGHPIRMLRQRRKRFRRLIDGQPVQREEGSVRHGLIVVLADQIRKWRQQVCPAQKTAVSNASRYPTDGSCCQDSLRSNWPVLVSSSARPSGLVSPRARFRSAIAHSSRELDVFKISRADAAAAAGSSCAS